MTEQELAQILDEFKIRLPDHVIMELLARIESQYRKSDNQKPAARGLRRVSSNE